MFTHWDQNSVTKNLKKRENKKSQDSGDKEEEFTLTCLLRDEFQLREVEETKFAK